MNLTELLLSAPSLKYRREKTRVRSRRFVGRTRKPKKCEYCGEIKVPTKDHILPKCYGVSLPKKLGIKLFRHHVCVDCNQARATCGHCTMVLILALQESKHLSIDLKDILVGWGFMRLRKMSYRRYLSGVDMVRKQKEEVT